LAELKNSAELREFNGTTNREVFSRSDRKPDIQLLKIVESNSKLD
jgi:hypothetical protein